MILLTHPKTQICSGDMFLIMAAVNFLCATVNPPVSKLASVSLRVNSLVSSNVHEVAWSGKANPISRFDPKLWCRQNSFSHKVHLAPQLTELPANC